MKKIIFVTIFIVCFLLTGFNPVKEALAQARIISPNYEIQFPNLNSGAGLPESASYSINATIGRIAGEFSSDGYIVKAGFQYVSSIIPFSFTLSKYNINFGTLYHDSAVIDTADITVKAGGAGGYSVKAYANHPLQDSSTSSTIIDTLCDSGLPDPCSQTAAKNWTSDSTYGFGFNIWGDDIPDDFASQNHYRQFADNSVAEPPAVIMSKTHVTYDYPNNLWPWESEATITFKVNIGPLQPAGTYQNYLTFIALPSF